MNVFFLSAIQDLTEDHVGAFLQKIGMQCYCKSFADNHIDGVMLEAMIHPTLGDGVMKNIGFTNENVDIC